jgi:hypothetical protein
MAVDSNGYHENRLFFIKTQYKDNPEEETPLKNFNIP